MEELPLPKDVYVSECCGVAEENGVPVGLIRLLTMTLLLANPSSLVRGGAGWGAESEEILCGLGNYQNRGNYLRRVSGES